MPCPKNKTGTPLEFLLFGALFSLIVEIMNGY